MGKFVVFVLLGLIHGCVSFAINDEEVFVDDMRLSKDQYEWVFGITPDQEAPSVRKATNLKALRWPNGEIPYTIHSSVQNIKDAIHEAINTWMNNTCLIFTEVPGTHPEHHVVFTKKNGCWSDVGRKYWLGAQELSVGFGCEKPGKIMHEIGHLIGLFHEQSRPDRDSFIKIFYENMNPAKKVNFKKEVNVDNYSVPYDYDSVMHYSVEAFSENGKKTIMPLDPTKEFVIGQRDHLSFNDIKIVNLMYSCQETCKTSEKCKNGGYAFGSHCRCQCPQGFTGSNCETPVHTETCNAVITVPSNITTPNYPMNYPGDKKCIWWIKAPAGKKAKITFKDFDLRQREDDKTCYWDHVELRLTNNYEGDLYCGEELKMRSFTSQNEEAVMVFESKMRLNRGFLASVEFI